MRTAPLVCLIATLVITSSGCALPTGGPVPWSVESLTGNSAAPLKPNASAQVFQKIKQAKHENAVILQVEGDSEPLRVLPLPQEEGQAVFVSDLLTQTGVFRQFGRIEAELFRNSTNLMDGVRMRVDLKDGDMVAPGTDYALRPGDRLVVRRATTTAFGEAFGDLVPQNAMRGLLGY